MIKTVIVLLILCCLAGAVILRAVRAMKRQIDADAADVDDWTGAKRFGGRFMDASGAATESPPPEEEVRRTWIPVRAPTSGAFGKPKADGDNSQIDEAQLRKYVKWCDARSKFGWLIILPVTGTATLWFQDQSDAQNFARAWHPLAGT